MKLTIEKLASNGDGIARHEGKVVFVPWSVPGDVVSIQIERDQRDFSEGRLLTIEQPSPDRVAPPCPYFYKCGGCQLQQMTYEAQLRWKKEIVREALERIGGLRSAAVSDVIPSRKIWNYRSRIQLHSDRKGRVGFYSAGSHQIVEIESCLIADERLNEQLLSLRATGGRVAIPRDTTGDCFANARNDRSGELRTDTGSSFTQINSAQNDNLIRLVLEMSAIKTSDKILELYCGDGNLSLPLAQGGAELNGIDRDSAALDEGRKKSNAAGLKNIRFVCGDVTAIIKSLLQEKRIFDLLVVDPPRRGLEGVAERLTGFGARKIIYVSCNPATFARDAKTLLQSGYELKECQPLDMFPQTAHVEMIGLFYKNLSRFLARTDANFNLPVQGIDNFN